MNDTLILLLFLYHICTILSMSLSDSVSIAIFIKWERLFSPRRYIRRASSSGEKLHSTEADANYWLRTHSVVSGTLYASYE